MLKKHSKTGKIEAIIYEEGASEGKRELDLGLLAAIRERRANCDNCPEKRIAKALDDIASENPGFGWSVIGECEKYLIIKPPNLEDAVRRFCS